MTPALRRAAPAVDAVAALGTILTVWAHPDDEAFLAAGLLHRAVAAGTGPVCVTATLGERGTDDPERWPPERLAAVRAQELDAALAVLGVEDRRVLGFVDGTLAGVPPAVGRAAVAEVIADVRPDTVVTFGSDGFTGHADHRAVGRWTAAAFAAAAPPGARLLQVARTPQWWSDGPGSWVDLLMDRDDRTLTRGVPADDLSLALRLDDDALDAKLAALLAHRSQVGGLLDALGAERLRLWGADEQFVDAAPAGHDRGGGAVLSPRSAQVPAAPRTW